jgi:hypothetical protein
MKTFHVILELETPDIRTEADDVLVLLKEKFRELDYTTQFSSMKLISVQEW